MVILVEVTLDSEGQTSSHPSPIHAPQCLLCRKLFGSDRALRRHTTSTHLFHRLCPQSPRPCLLCDPPINERQSDQSKCPASRNESTKENAIARPGPNITGWWVCCNCRCTMNPALAQSSCSICGHHKCLKCYIPRTK